LQPAVWIAIYLPIFTMLFILIPSQQRKIYVARKYKKRRGAIKLSNELIKNCLGKECNISTGSLGSSFNKVKIVEVIDNWIKVESKGKEDLINVDFIQSIKILPEKN